jgi:lipopolysaccharide exporter
MQSFGQQIKNNLSKLRFSKSLKVRAARGGLWLGAASGGENALRLVRNMILTRILAPEAFGIMAIVLALNAAFESFTGIGIKQAIIHNQRGHEPTYINAAWWLSFGRAIGLYAIGFITAPWIADFYGNQELVLLIRIAFLGIIFRGAMSSRAHVAIKDMRFKQWALINHGGGVIGIITAIILAFIIKNVWALVIGFTVESVARCLLSYIICYFRPGLNFEKRDWKALLKYAGGMFGLPILTFIFMRCDVFVIGKLCTSYDLGLYSMAVALAWVPLQLIGALFGEIAMPAFSEIQTEKGLLGNIITHSSTAMAFLGIPAFFLLMLYGKEILFIIFGDKYMAVSLPFAIIFLSALLRTISIPFATLFLAIGKPELHRLFTGVRAILILALIYPFVKFWGLPGAAMASLISMSVSFVLQIFRASTIVDLRLRQYTHIFGIALCISLPVIIVWLATYHTLSLSNTSSMLTGLFGCMVSYALALWIFLKSDKYLLLHKLF